MKWILAASIFIYSCNSHRENVLSQKTEDSISQVAATWADSAVKSSILQASLDTVGVAEGPVKVLLAEIIRSDYSSSVHITYKNVSSKKISAIRFKWYGINAFNEPADFGSGIDGIGGGFTDNPLSPGKTDTRQWTSYTKDGKKIQFAWAYEIVFADGSKWKSSRK